MNKKKLQSLNITIILLFLLSGVFASAIVLLVVALATGMWSKAMSNALLASLVGVFVALLLVGVSLIAVFFFKRATIIRSMDWLKELISKDVDILSPEEFEATVAKSMSGKGNSSTLFVAALSLFAFRGQPISNYGPTYVLSFNEIAYDAISETLDDKENITYALNSQNIYYIAGRMKSREEFSELLQTILGKINDDVALQPSLPPLYALGGYLDATKCGSAEEAMKQAAYAMNYKPAQRFSGDIKLFSDEMIAARERYRALDSEIDRALEKKEFLIFYQPKWDVARGAFYGAEALIRWRHPQRGFLPPSIFIAAAEASGKIVDIDHYVFEAVCSDLEKWNRERRRPLVISINLSRRSVFDTNIIPFLAETVKKHHVDPKQIEIELTESIAAQFSDQIRHVILKIKALGFSTSMDDFGVGYSSLSSIKKISFDVVKLDKGFIDDIENSAKSKVFVASIINLIHSMRITVIAEGVETDKQVEILKEQNLDAIQGYYYSRPLERSRFEAFLEENPFEKKKEEEAL